MNCDKCGADFQTVGVTIRQEYYMEGTYVRGESTGETNWWAITPKGDPRADPLAMKVLTIPVIKCAACGEFVTKEVYKEIFPLYASDVDE